MWFKVDDSFYDHPKVFDAPDCAVALWTRAGTWSARNLTDGFVPAKLPARLCDDHDTAVRELVDRGLWQRTKGGYRFRDWTAYQPTATQVRDLRSKRAEAGRLGGQAKSDKQTAGKRQASARDVAKQNPAPARPGPSASNEALPPCSPPTGEEFARFWSAYPRKDGKAAARKAWSKACRKLTADELIDQAQRWSALWAAAGVEQRFIPHASTWLNGERWNDSEPAPCTGQQSATDANIALLLGDRSTLRALPGGGA